MRAPPSRRPLPLVVAALLLTACGALETSPSPWLADGELPIDPERMVVRPDTAEAGQVVELFFPHGLDRGLAFAIDEEQGGRWFRMFHLVSDASGGRPAWFGPDQEFAVESIGIAGVGPDHVPIPDALEAGDYRICTANAAVNICARVEVTDPRAAD